jgi:hypothetical protein
MENSDYGLYIICGKPKTGKTAVLKKWAVDPILSTERVGKYLQVWVEGKEVDMNTVDIRKCLDDAIRAPKPQKIIALDDAGSLTGLIDELQQTTLHDIAWDLIKNHTTLYIVLEREYEITGEMYANAKGICFTSEGESLKDLGDRRGWRHLRKESLDEYDPTMEPNNRFSDPPNWPKTFMARYLNCK